MKNILVVFVALTLLLTFSSSAFALNDPMSVVNNKYGIHIMDENDLVDAASLVNSNGGDWGYVTLVITESERNHARWQKVLDDMRYLHLIPIIRIATKAQGDTWEKPRTEEINNWIAFLNSLNWVVENRYIIIGNEPNHAKEWGGKIAPDEYSNYLKDFSTALKAAHEDFYILPAGLDASASNSEITMSANQFLKTMLQTNPDVFNYVDGWNSHSYPNPAFSGLASAQGRGTISSYRWELEYLKSLGVDKDLSVFITETGWSNVNLTETEISEKFSYAFNNVWTDERIVAVTPFILNYPSPPFDQFSWKKADGSFHAFYNSVRDLPKVKGEPVQVVQGKIMGVFLNPFVLAGSSLKGIVFAQNQGQSIWVDAEIEIGDENKNITFNLDPFEPVEPEEFRFMHISSQELKTSGIYRVPLVLLQDGENVSSSYNVDIFVIEPPQVKSEGIFDKIREFVKN